MFRKQLILNTSQVPADFNNMKLREIYMTNFKTSPYTVL